MPSIDVSQQIATDHYLRESLKEEDFHARQKMDERTSEYRLGFLLMWLDYYLKEALSQAEVEFDGPLFEAERERAVRNFRLHLDETVTADNQASSAVDG